MLRHDIEMTLFEARLEGDFKDDIIAYMLNDESIFISFILAKEKSNIALAHKLR